MKCIVFIFFLFYDALFVITYAFISVYMVKLIAMKSC